MGSTKKAAQKIAYAVRCAADVAIRLADPEWCELIFVSFGDELGEVPETLQIGAMAARVKVRGEVARLYLHIDDPVSFTIMRDAIRVALKPFLMGGRQFVVHDSAEGIEVVLLDEGEIQDIHNATPENTTAPL
jgi:hypothetical protein